MQKILFTAEKDNSSVFCQELSNLREHLLHLPLEHTDFYVRKEDAQLLSEQLQTVTYTIFGNLRNARHFTSWVKENNLMTNLKQMVHLVSDRPTFNFLESEGYAAIMPAENAKGIDILEFLLRISKEGTVLYPTSENHTEEIPGLLKELDMPVIEFTVCKERSLTQHERERYVEKIKSDKPDTVIFHNRSSVNRIKMAFPELNLAEMKIISGDVAVTNLLKEHGLDIHAEASGSWQSLSKTIQQCYS